MKKEEIEEEARKIIGDDCRKENCLQCGGVLSANRGCIQFRRMMELANWILEQSYDISTLSSWYQCSVFNDEEPIWTDKHLEELMKDFYLIPKE